MVNGTLDSELCSPEHLRSARNSKWSMLNAQWSMVNGQCSMVNAQWSMVNGQWSMVNAQCSMVNGQWSMVNVQCSTVNGQRSMVNGLAVFPPGGKGRSHKWDEAFPLVGRVVPTGGTPNYLLVYFPGSNSTPDRDQTQVHSSTPSD